MNAIVDQRKTVTAPAAGRDRAATLAGALLAATGVGIVLSTITNEALYPAARHYSTFADTISARISASNLSEANGAGASP